MPIGTNKTDYVVWVLLLAAEIGLLATVLRRSRVLAEYLGLKITRSVGLLFIGLTQSYEAYFYSFWLLTALVTLAILPLLGEIFDFSIISFRHCFVIMVLLGLLTLASNPSPSSDPLMTVVRMLERFSWIVIVGMFLWGTNMESFKSRTAYGIGLGLAVFAAGQLFKTLLIAQFDFAFIKVFARIPHVLYPVSLGIWFWYVARSNTPIRMETEHLELHLRKAEGVLLCR